MVYESRFRPLLPWPAFLRRASQHLSWGVLFACGAVAIGTIGYHELASLDWIDAFLNASMILSGEGPVDQMTTDGAKVFAAVYALFSGVVFIGVMGVVLAPWLHRLLHKSQLQAPNS